MATDHRLIMYDAVYQTKQKLMVDLKIYTKLAGGGAYLLSEDRVADTTRLLNRRVISHGRIVYEINYDFIYDFAKKYSKKTLGIWMKKSEMSRYITYVIYLIAINETKTFTDKMKLYDSMWNHLKSGDARFLLAVEHDLFDRIKAQTELFIPEVN